MSSFLFWSQGSAKTHIPDVTKEKPFTDILVMCSLGVMLNVFCHMTYSAPGLDRSSKMNNAQIHLWNDYVVNGLSEDSRKLLCLTRGQSIEIISWLCLTYATGIPNMPVQKLFSTVLLPFCLTYAECYATTSGRLTKRKLHIRPTLPLDGSRPKSMQC